MFVFHLSFASGTPYKWHAVAGSCTSSAETVRPSRRITTSQPTVHLLRADEPNQHVDAAAGRGAAVQLQITISKLHQLIRNVR